MNWTLTIGPHYKGEHFESTMCRLIFYTDRGRHPNAKKKRRGSALCACLTEPYALGPDRKKMLNVVCTSFCGHTDTPPHSTTRCAPMDLLMRRPINDCIPIGSFWQSVIATVQSTSKSREVTCKGTSADMRADIPQLAARSDGAMTDRHHGKQWHTPQGKIRKCKEQPEMMR